VWGEHGIQSVAVRSSTSVLSAFTHPLVVRGFEKSPEESSLDSGQEDVPVVLILKQIAQDDYPKHFPRC
jgi:hypothetical protein